MSEHTPMKCNHAQCCICLERECQIPISQPRFRKFGGLTVCGESCITTAIAVTYHAACRLGVVTEKPCGKTLSRESTHAEKEFSR